MPKKGPIFLTIEPEKLIREVQEEFTTVYPFLKIEFFKNGKLHQNRHHASSLYAHHLKLKEARLLVENSGTLPLSDIMTVQQLEKTFQENFGLSVQVFRRSGNLWLETTMTDNWTLKQQNEHGKEISIGKIPQKNIDSDYDLNRDAEH